MLKKDQFIPNRIRSEVSPEGYLLIFGGLTTDDTLANLAVKYRVIYTISLPNVINWLNFLEIA